ncbi:MAG TPA: peptidoglycan DD-metalloendopeptidase family protein [Solirubrobacteraceae bacterium]|nr:peptidoglycan DD-metalloendopeptidase family protein [Solirubrobacteraceae bacterium]
MRPRRRALVALAAIATLVPVAVVAGSVAQSGPPAPPPAPPEFRVLDAKVSPRHAYFAGRPVAITFRLSAPEPMALQVDVVRDKTDKPVRRLTLPAAAPQVAQRVEWDGLTGGGKVAPNGSYRIRIRGDDGRVRRGGTFRLRSHMYPVRGRHGERGLIGTFGVARNGGRIHEGFDVNAACGTPLVAARGGRVVRAGYDPVLYGNVVIIRGERTQRDYWYSHMKHTPRLRVGDRVRTGQRIGSVGDTGNARTIGCHLHFEIHSRGRPIDPAPELRAWDRWS